MEKSNFGLLILGLGISWGTCWFLIIPISIIALFVVFFKLKRRKSHLTKYLILLNPFFILPLTNLGIGSTDYLQGFAKLKIVGYPTPEFANLSHNYRLENYSLGCTFTGIEYFTAFPYNGTVKFLTSQFGYQKNSYSGIYPTKDEAIEFIKRSAKFSDSIFNDDGHLYISIGSESWLIELDKQHPLIQGTLKNEQSEFITKIEMISNECLVAQLNSEWLYIIELENGKIIAQYGI